MEKEIRSVDTILFALQEKVSNKEIIDAASWITGAEMLNVLLGEETDKLFDLQQKVASEKVARIRETKCSVAQAKLEVESLDIFRDMQKQKAKIERVIEFIRIAKLQSRIKMEEYKNS